ncbi:RmlC-like cupin domain-containing protein [Nemania sp. NC0429]|nr:RmlC-like cupin domain-containing protein [Nemania sp. NC0429]
MSRLMLLAVYVACAILSLHPAAQAAQTQCDRVSSSSSSSSSSRHDHDHDHDQHQPTAKQVVAKLGLVPNVEGGYYVETFRDEALLPGSSSNRSVSTAIYYLLEGPRVPSVWHRVDAAEVWHWYAGAPLVLQLSSDNGTPTRDHVLGPDVLGHQRPQVVVPGLDWQRAISCGKWTLVGTTVAPAFVPEGYELAPDGWEPNDGSS